MDLVMHGAGQDAASFRDYWDYMGNTTKPMVFMTYTSLRMTQPEIEAYFMQLEADCAAYGDERFVLPQIGLSMTAGGKGYDDDVAAGKLDDNIGWFATAISQQLKRPCYVRIGYEFNGQWNNYNVSTYPQAFNRVAKVLRDTKMVATVWDYSADAQVNRLDFLQWVTEPALTDWIGVNIFSGASQATAPGSGVPGSKVVERFLEEYSDNPYQAIMIGESTPRGSGAQDGNNSWGQWYEPYFTMINDGDYNFQSFNYINWDWSNSSKPYFRKEWSAWGNAEIQGTVVGERYKANMAVGHHQFRYMHGAFSLEQMLFRSATVHEAMHPRKIDTVWDIIANREMIKQSWASGRLVANTSTYFDAECKQARCHRQPRGCLPPAAVADVGRTARQGRTGGASVLVVNND